jgi:hypothetical protein
MDNQYSETKGLSERISDLLERNEVLQKSNDELLDDVMSILEEINQYIGQIQSPHLRDMIDKYFT